MLPVNNNDFKFYFYSTLNLVIAGSVALLLFGGIAYYSYDIWFYDLRYLKYLFFVFQSENFYISKAFWSVVIASLSFILAFFYLQNKNLYKPTRRFSKFANLFDIKRMQPNILREDGFSLGIFKNKFLRTNEPLALLCVAPAGAGKTSGTVVPTILSCDRDSLVINDPKGELYDITAKYRKSLGKIFRIAWKEEVEGEDTTYWNPLALENLPKETSDRAELIEVLANILIKEGGSDPFWANSARKILTAVMLYMVYLEELENKSSSIAYCKDFLATIGVVAEEEENAEEDEDVFAKKNDPIQDNFKKYAKEFKEKEEIPLVIRERVYNVFAEMSTTSPNTLGSILATVSADLLIFNNEKVRNITSQNTFNMTTIRGIDNQPVTIYLVSPAFDQDIYGVLSGIFVEFATRYITSQDLEYVKKSRVVRFILDEVAFFPKIKSVEQGPAIARGYKGSYLFVCQDLGQLEQKYKREGLENIITNTAFKIILPQNNDVTAKRLASMAGQKEVFEWQGADKNRHRVKKMINLIEATDIMNLPSGKQIVIVQNNAKTPIFCDIPFFFKNAEMKRKIKS